jgi:hypothetical protein
MLSMGMVGAAGQLKRVVGLTFPGREFLVKAAKGRELFRCKERGGGFGVRNRKR